MKIKKGLTVVVYSKSSLKRLRINVVELKIYNTYFEIKTPKNKTCLPFGKFDFEILIR